jgi:2-methylisocitrate lyase-like PEP mutase family enzyme
MTPMRRVGALDIAGGQRVDHLPVFAIGNRQTAALHQAFRPKQMHLLDEALIFGEQRENLLHGRKDMADTIKRLQAFEAAGADVLYAPGLSTLDEVRAVVTAVKKPVNVLVVASAKDFTLQTLAAAGVKRISVGGTLSRVAYGGALLAANEMKEKGTFSFTFGGVSNKELNTIFGKWV